MKKFLKLLLIIAICTTFVNVKADSGWDSDYDSGSSWSSSDSGGSHSGSSRSMDLDDISSAEAMFIIPFYILFAIIFYGFYKSSLNESAQTNRIIDYSERFHDITEEELKELLPNETLDSLKLKLFNNFVEIQEAWMNFDYDKLKKLCSNELFNMYKSQLEALKMKNGQNIMDSFSNESLKIYNIIKVKNQVMVSIYLKVTFHDYVINTESKFVTRGSSAYLIRNQYTMTFVINTDEVITECPSCGAKIDDLADGKCKYCDSEIINNTKDYVLTDKNNLKTEALND